MTIPNAEHAIVDERKLRSYLLSESHPIGRFKAAFFAKLGYSVENWDRLREDILVLARTSVEMPGKPSLFGKTFQVDGMLSGPSGYRAEVRTIWIVRQSDGIPRLVTVFPR